MEDKRVETLEALSTFMQTQKTLLQRTQSDIVRLRDLRAAAFDHPQSLVSDLHLKLRDEVFRINERLEYAAGPPTNLDWSLYTSADIAPIHNLGLTARTTHALRNRPHPKQRSELSELQVLVRDARRVLIDPVLARLPPLSASPPSSEDELDPEEIKREREREKIRELKKRRVGCGLTLPSFTRNAVFIRQDQQDESAEVDISMDTVQLRTEGVSMDADRPSRLVSPTSLPSSLPSTHSKPSRARRPTTKFESQDVPPLRVAKRKADSIPTHKADSEVLSLPDDTPKPAKSKRSRDTGKPKPETYKQAWSISEQHLLERLLDEIPDGEKNRWQKISRAMEGKRTPRQVASRVQKYFEKLKRFGVGVTTGNLMTS